METVANIILWVLLAGIGVIALIMTLIALLRLFTLTSAADSLSGLLDNLIHPMLKGLQKGKYIIIAVLLISAGIYGYMNFESIDKPIRFEKKYKKRYNAVVENLKEIRTAQEAYRDVNGDYAGHFDTLVDFIEKDSLIMILSIGSVDDTLLTGNGGRTMFEAEQIAIERGYIVRDTSKISVLDSLYKGDMDKVKELRFIPYSNGQEFEIESGSVSTQSGLTVPVFEVRAPFDTFLKDLGSQDKQYRQLIGNIKAEADRLGRYRGLKVGDINEATNNEGNWEK